MAPSHSVCPLALMCTALLLTSRMFAKVGVVFEMMRPTLIGVHLCSHHTFTLCTPLQNWMSGKTNIFMVFLLKPKSTEIVIQEREIAKCR